MTLHEKSLELPGVKIVKKLRGDDEVTLVELTNASRLDQTAKSFMFRHVNGLVTKYRYGFFVWKFTVTP